MSQRSQKVPTIKSFVTPKGTFVAREGDLLGKGTYGVVYKVQLENDPEVKRAVKTFTPETMDESEGVPSTTLREINALKSLDHPNVLKSEQVVMPEDPSALSEMFVVMELCKGTLKDKVISLIQEHLHSDRSWLQPQPGARLPKSYVRETKLIAYSLINALAYIHAKGVMHRDLKPVNIMWAYNGLLKVGDFGLARFIRGNQHSSSDQVIPQTGEVQTMWYRAPEVLLGDDKYGMKVDDWSVGCIIAELFRFKLNSKRQMEPEPLFNGRSDAETLMLNFETLGTPKVDSGYKKEEMNYFQRLQYWSNGFPQWIMGNLHKRVPLIDSDGLDLVRSLLEICPNRRQSCRFLLNHRWFDDIRGEVNKFIVPWYRDSEQEYIKMIAADKLPAARPLRLIEEEERRKAAKKIEQEVNQQVSANQGRANCFKQNLPPNLRATNQQSIVPGNYSSSKVDGTIPPNNNLNVSSHVLPDVPPSSKQLCRSRSLTKRIEPSRNAAALRSESSHAIVGRQQVEIANYQSGVIRQDNYRAIQYDVSAQKNHALSQSNYTTKTETKSTLSTSMATSGNTTTTSLVRVNCNGNQSSVESMNGRFLDAQSEKTHSAPLSKQSNASNAKHGAAAPLSFPSHPITSYAVSAQQKSSMPTTESFSETALNAQATLHIKRVNARPKRAPPVRKRQVSNSAYNVANSLAPVGFRNSYVVSRSRSPHRGVVTNEVVRRPRPRQQVLTFPSKESYCSKESVENKTRDPAESVTNQLPVGKRPVRRMLTRSDFKTQEAISKSNENSQEKEYASSNI